MPIVFVHGVPETDAIWDPLVTELGRDDVIRLSPPGFGAPVPESFEPVRRSYLAWLTQELESIDGPVDLVGHDWGAGHTAGLVTSRPELVRSWTIDVAGIVHRDYEWHEMAQAWRTPEVGEQVIEQMMAASAEDKAGLFEGMGMSADVARRVAAGNDETMGRCILALYRSADPDELRTIWDALATAQTSPGLVLIPTEDHYAGPFERAEEVADRAGAQTRRLPDLGHWWMTQDPVLAAGVLSEFWSGL